MSVNKVFGPVPSRRLGKSIGVNNIPPKICSYSCAYCQIGRSLKLSMERKPYYDPEDLVSEVNEKIEECLKKDEVIDFITVVPDGEPTLDINLGRLLRLLKSTGYKTAVITNSTLLPLPELRRELSEADWVSVKVDTVDEKVWRLIDHPHRGIDFDKMLIGIESFAREYNGYLVTETMLARGINDSPTDAVNRAAYIAGLNPQKAYLSIPTRPPAEPKVQPPEEFRINEIFQIYQDHGIASEYLIGYEGNDFAFTGNIEDDILSITSVHPMKEEAIMEYLKKAEGSFSNIEKLLSEEKLAASVYNGNTFYLRKFKNGLSPKPT